MATPGGEPLLLGSDFLFFILLRLCLLSFWTIRFIVEDPFEFVPLDKVILMARYIRLVEYATTGGDQGVRDHGF